MTQPVRRLNLSVATIAAAALAATARAQEFPSNGSRLNDNEGYVSAVCVIDPLDMSARGDSAAAIAFDRPARRAPEDATQVPPLRGFPLAVLPFEVDGAPPVGGVVEDIVFVDEEGVWSFSKTRPLRTS